MGMSTAIALDAKAKRKRLASFKTSLVNLKAAMRQRQMIRKPGDADTTDADADANATTSSHQQQQQEQPPHDHANTNSPSSTSSPPTNKFLSWIHTERECFARILLCAALGAILGFAIGAGWLTRRVGFVTSGYHHYMTSENPTADEALTAMSPKTEELVDNSKRVVRYFIVGAWRVRLAKNIRGLLLYKLLTLNTSPWRILLDLYPSSPNRLWVAASPLWPPNWLLFREVDLSQIEVGDRGFSPLMASCLSFILPWHSKLIHSLAVKEKFKVDLRYHDGRRINEPTFMSTSSPTSLFSSILPLKPSNQRINPYHHPMAFHVLREHIIRFDNGFVHPDLGFLVPAPSGAERGIGMVRNTYTKCQVHCNPGTAEEKLRYKMEAQTQLEQSEMQDRIDEELMEEMKKEFPGIMATASMESVGSSTSSVDFESVPPQLHNRPVDDDRLLDPIRNTTTYAGIQNAVQLQQLSSNTPYSQSEILLRIPIEAQITRKLALDTLTGLILHELPGRQTHLEELDDGFVLAVYLAHERGLGQKSRIWPYIATLPPRPTCALNWGWRQSIVDVVTALSMEMGTDVQGWPNEISKAAEAYEMIVMSLSRQFGDLLATRPGAEDVTENIRWALCHVASRAIAGKDSHGRLRLVPMLDMINHDAAADKYMELSGTEKLEDGHILDADENDAGTFVVRSRRHGERKPLKKGQELMANYNVPDYSPLDWFLNMGYIPPERAGKWTMLEAALPRSYRGGFSRKSNTPGVRTKSAGAFGNAEPEVQVTRQYTQQQSRSI